MSETKEKVFKRLLNAFRSFLVSDLAKDHEIALRKGPLDLSEQEIQKHVDSLREEYENSDELDENINSWLKDYRRANEGDEPDVETVERGWPGHFIAANNCAFTRNTLVRCDDKKVVVSTVGRYYPDGTDEEETIRLGTYFETMAFWADDTKFADADISERFHLDGRTSIGHNEPYADIQADAMHNKRVEEVKGRLKNGYEAKEIREESSG